MEIRISIQEQWVKIPGCLRFSENQYLQRGKQTNPAFVQTYLSSVVALMLSGWLDLPSLPLRSTALERYSPCAVSAITTSAQPYPSPSAEAYVTGHAKPQQKTAQI